jgi:predicted O-linked N-acetylglucosamine transferase (SPINDLY family)
MIPKAAALVREGLVHHRAGRLDDAERLYREALGLVSEQADALHYLGVLAHQRGDHAGALGLIGRALAVAPRDPDIHANRGEVLRALGRMAEAKTAYESALALAPGHPAALFNLGIVLGLLDDHAGAERCYRRLLVRHADAADAHYALGNTLLAQNRPADAETAFAEAVRLDPGLAEAHLNLGIARLALARPAEALPVLERAVELAPTSAAAHVQLADALMQLRHGARARRHLVKARALAPKRLDVRWALACDLPTVYAGEAEIAERRAEFERGLAEIEADLALDTPDAIEEAFRAAGTFTNFHLAYQGRDDRALQRCYGALVARAMAAAFPDRTRPLAAPPPEPDGRLRVAFVSAFFRWHTVARLFRGWIESLDRRRFKIMVWHLGETADGTSAEVARAADTFRHCPPVRADTRKAFADLSGEVAAARPHALIYPEIGMDPRTFQLAALRLAPVQAAWIGHPVTTGLPTVDYFLSGELIEPPDGKEHYSEKLVRLLGLGIAYRPFGQKPSAKTRTDFDVGAGQVLYLCCQSLYKYLPRHDRIFPAIAREVGDAVFAFLAHGDESVDEVFRTRIARAFADAGLDAKTHCRFLPRLDNADYYALNAAGDVYLDSLGWSGGNTTLEAISAELPVVTLPGEFMRGRVSYGMLRMIGVEDTVAKDVDDYIAIAVRLGREPEFRAQTRARIAANRHKLYNDEKCVRGLEDFLIRAVQSGG